MTVKPNTMFNVWILSVKICVYVSKVTVVLALHAGKNGIQKYTILKEVYFKI